MKAKTPISYNRLSPEQKQAIERYVDELANERAAECVHKSVGMIISCAVMLAVRVLVKQFGFGTRDNAKSRVLKFVKAFETMGTEYSNKYDDVMYEALKLHLKNEGIEFGDEI